MNFQYSQEFCLRQARYLHEVCMDDPDPWLESAMWRWLFIWAGMMP